MSKEEVMALAIGALLDAGFVPDGKTRQEHIKTGNSQEFCLQLATVGGRLRFARPDTNIKATVGARTTCIYGVVDSGVEPISTVDTKDLETIKAALAALSGEK